MSCAPRSDDAVKSARWLAYVEFDRIVDQRNSPPVVRTFEPPDPAPAFRVGELWVQLADELDPRVELADFRGIQPYRLACFGEKVSLEPVLAPICEAHGADVYLPTGETASARNRSSCSAPSGRASRDASERDVRVTATPARRAAPWTCPASRTPCSS